MKKVSNIISMAFIILSIIIILAGLRFPISVDGVPGAGYFPIAIAVLMIGMSFAHITMCCFDTSQGPAHSVKLISKENSRVWVSIGSTAIYLYAMTWIGFVIATPIYLFSILWFFKVRNKIVLATIPLGLTGMIYLIFTVALSVILPSQKIF